jgi:hypothetical protein
MLLFSAAVMLCTGCGISEPSSNVQRDQFVEIKSELGHVLVAPSEWTFEDRGDSFLLQSPDGHAWIHALTVMVEGSGSIEEFREIIVSKCLPKDATKWAPSIWSDFPIGQAIAQKCVLLTDPPTEREWRVYVLQIGTYYHAIILSATDLAMEANGDFYESIVLTFQPASEGNANRR